VLFGYCSRAVGLNSAQSVKADFGSPSPSVFAVPKVDALDQTPLTGQIDDPGLPAVGNARTDWNLFLGVPFP
jgi:hypothetical protein